MPKHKKAQSHNTQGLIEKEHDQKIVDAIHRLVKHESIEDPYTDAILSKLIREQGLLCTDGKINSLRKKNKIPNCRERQILRFAEQHKAK